MEQSLVDAFELVATSERLLPRLAAAATEVAKVPSLADEKAWLTVAERRLRAALAGVAPDLLVRALRIPELEPIKGDHARTLQGTVVDTLERLHGAIVAAGGPRTPVLEMLYLKLKVPALRKCDRDEFNAFCTDFEKRLKTTYVKRMFDDPDFAGAAAAAEGLVRAIATWRSIFVAAPATGEEAAALRADLELASQRLRGPGRQARLLAQAALVPLAEVDAATLLALETKRRKGKAAVDEDDHPLLEQDPPDPRAPTPEERAELAG